MVGVADVVIVGAGPTGLLLANELIRQGVTPIVVDSREDPAVVGDKKWSKALGIHARSLEILDTLGIANEFLSLGIGVVAANAINPKGETIMRLENLQNLLQSKFKIILALPQYETERLLRKSLAERGGSILWGSKVTEMKETVDNVTLTIDGKDPITVKWVVGCDGGHSIVRKSMGIAFEGEDIQTSFAMASVKMEFNLPPDEGLLGEGFFIILPEPGNRARLILPITDEEAEQNKPHPPLEWFQKKSDEAFPSLDIKLSEPQWLTIFRIRERLADTYRCGRVFLAGDAAHTHSPAGGQGMNTGFQDSFNLAWKLALVLKGVGHTQLLNTYNEERRPVAAALLRNSGRATQALLTSNPIIKGARQVVMSNIPRMQFLHQRMAQQIGMLDISYEKSSIVKDELSNWNWINIGSSTMGIGSRAPHHELHPYKSEKSVLFMDVCSETTAHNLFLFCSEEDVELMNIATQKLARLHNYLRIHLVVSCISEPTPQHFSYIFLDEHMSLSSRFGIHGTGFALIRPDHHLAYRDSPANITHLCDYLHQIFI